MQGALAHIDAVTAIATALGVVAAGLGLRRLVGLVIPALARRAEIAALAARLTPPRDSGEGADV